MKGLINKGLLVVAVVSLASCDYQKYNTIRQKDYRLDDQYVYGPGLDSPAVQSKYKYTARPELDQRTAKIRQKLFGQGTAVTQGQ
jgi:hypothetical protein